METSSAIFEFVVSVRMDRTILFNTLSAVLRPRASARIVADATNLTTVTCRFAGRRSVAELSSD
jgi:hypothetical protein